MNFLNSRSDSLDSSVAMPGMPVGTRSSGACPAASIGSAAMGTLRWRKRKGHSEGRSFGGATGHKDLAMHGIVKLADNPEANAEATLLAPGHRALEGTEDASLIFFRDADSVILNSQSR